MAYKKWRAISKAVNFPVKLDSTFERAALLESSDAADIRFIYFYF